MQSSGVSIEICYILVIHVITTKFQNQHLLQKLLITSIILSLVNSYWV